MIPKSAATAACVSPAASRAGMVASSSAEAFRRASGLLALGSRPLLAGIEPAYVNVTPADPVAYVISMVAARLREYYAKAAKERQREHGGTAPGREKNTSAQKGHSVEESPSLASEQAGAALGVSRRSVDRARMVNKNGTP